MPVFNRLQYHQITLAPYFDLGARKAKLLG